MPITLRIVASRLSVIRRSWRYARISSVSEPDAAGWLTVTADIETMEEACANVLSLGPDVEVIQPAELLDRVIESAEGIIQRYGPESIAGSRGNRPHTTS